jgi:hypothetical protein
MAEGDATVLYADAKPVAWVHPTCLEDYTTGAITEDGHEGDDLRLLLKTPPRKQHLPVSE